MGNGFSLEHQLDLAARLLRQQWDATKAQWGDEVQHNFEKEYWLPLEQSIQATRREMQHLFQLLAEARRNVH